METTSKLDPVNITSKSIKRSITIEKITVIGYANLHSYKLSTDD